MSAEKKVVTQPEKEKNLTLGYVIAAITLGAAIGNMFMAGKIRNVMKMEIPNPNAWKAEAKASSTREGSQNGAEHVAYKKAQAQVSVVPPQIVQHLNMLNLPHKLTVSEAEIKSAYRSAVMKYHPDRMKVTDAGKKAQFEAKFNQSTDAYKALIEFYVKS